ncbi:MAG: cation:dicarboxylase symporter family transporter [Rickettsiaceae bacterium]|nr:cation:dicarboxylase symporter family transporter [Rickettsiaceae bacterium]
MIGLLKYRSIQTIVALTIYAVVAPFLNIVIHEGLYTISLFIKDLLIWMMPITVCVLIASTIDSFEKKAPLFVLFLVMFEGTSNFLSVSYAFLCGNVISDAVPSFEIVNLDDSFKALWRIPIARPVWWGADKGSLLGLVFGCVSAISHSNFLKGMLGSARSVVESILTGVFARLIPLFVLGFIAQVYKTGLLAHMVLNYTVLVGYLVFFLAIYVWLIFGIGNNFYIRKMLSDIKNLMPAWFMALTSGCSLSTMPLTIEGTSKNLRDPRLARAIIPATTNIQQVGDCITNALLCFLMHKQFLGYAPDGITWMVFTMVFVAARFATAAVIGGAIFIMLPIYQNYLNFNDEMIAIILAMNVILDPIVTSTNVIANGGMAKIFENIWKKISD